MSNFKGVDYYNIESLLSPEEIMVRNTVREFVSDWVIPIIEKHNRESTFPIQLVPKMAELGLFGNTLPQKYGCAELNYVSYGLITQELERGDSGIRSFVSVQSSLVMYPIFRFGSDEQKDKWLSQLANGTKIGCYGLTEPDYGSNPSGMVTKAEKVDGGFVLNGAKMWITNGTIADVAVVWAKLDGIIRGFIVEKGMMGFTAPEMKGKHSLRASVTSELIFDNVFLPEKNLLLKTEGLKSALMCLNQARYGIAWGVVGAMMACYDSALNYAKSRKQFSKPIAGYQMTQEKLVYMLTEITKAQLLCWRLGVLKNENRATPAQISMAKRNNVNMALEITHIARQIHGGMGITGEYPIMRHMMNLESVITYEGTHDIHLLITGMDVTGLNAFE